MVLSDPAIALIIQWLPIGAIAITLSTFIVALAYMAGHFLTDEKLKAWGKSEAMQLFYSMLILVLILSLYGALNTILSSASSIDPQSAAICQTDPTTPGNLILKDNFKTGPYYVPINKGSASSGATSFYVPCHIALATNFLEQVYEGAKEMNRDFLGLSTFYHTYSSASVTFETLVPPTTAITFMPLIGLSIVADSIGVLFEMTVRLMVLLRLQEFFLMLIHRAIFPLFIIIGIVLRTFFFTRKLGGLLLAVALCFYTVYPGVYILGSYAFGQITHGDYTMVDINYDALPTLSSDPSAAAFPKPSQLNSNNPPPTTINPTPTDFCDQSTNANTPGFWSKVKDKLNFIRDLFSMRVFTMVKDQLQGAWLLGEGGSIDGVAQLAIYTTLLPFIAIMASLAAVKVMSPIFGGDVDIPGLSRLI